MHIHPSMQHPTETPDVVTGPDERCAPSELPMTLIRRTWVHLGGVRSVDTPGRGRRRSGGSGLPEHERRAA